LFAITAEAAKPASKRSVRAFISLLQMGRSTDSPLLESPRLRARAVEGLPPLFHFSPRDGINDIIITDGFTVNSDG
jgi:hypothetical protein